MKYGIKKQISGSYIESIEKVKEALKDEGFGVLTEIDVKATLKKKLNVDYDNYSIFGVCNPNLAYKALQNEQDIGLLLPCNVIIYEKEKKVFVNAIDPTVAMGFVENSALDKIAGEVKEKLLKVVNSL